MKCQKKSDGVRAAALRSNYGGWKGLWQEHLSNIIHLAGYCRMCFTLTSHRTWTLTRNHDLEALTGDTEKGGEERRVRERERLALIFCWAPRAANNQNKWLLWYGWKVGAWRNVNPLRACVCSSRALSQWFILSLPSGRKKPATAHSERNKSLRANNCNQPWALLQVLDIAATLSALQLQLALDHLLNYSTVHITAATDDY